MKKGRKGNGGETPPISILATPVWPSCCWCCCGTIYQSALFACAFQRSNHGLFTTDSVVRQGLLILQTDMNLRHRP